VNYLEAVKAIGPDQAERVMAKMKETPTDDPLFGKGLFAPTAVRCTYVPV
jgi:branched-chain amino acid transport system substrate-binding protein